MSHVTLGLEISTDDKRALKVMGNALLELAGEPIAQETTGDDTVVKSFKPPADTTCDDTPPPPPAAEAGNAVNTPTAPAPVNAGAESPTASTTENEGEQDDTPVDVDGHPWDKRIHSSSQEKNADGRWKARRKPKDYDKAQWDTFVQQVKDELNGGDATPPPAAAEVFTEQAPPPPAPAPVTEQAPPPPAPVTEQAPAPAPAPAPVTEQAPAETVTFQDLMKVITTSGGKIDNAKVEEICKSEGVDRFIDLNGAHPDKIPAVYAKVKAVVNG